MNIAQQTAFAAAEQLFNELVASATHPKRKKNLSLLWNTLNAMSKDGIRKFKVAEVGFRLQKVGGPTTQSLRNAGGADYLRIIKAFELAVTHARPPSPTSDLERALLMVSDQGARALIRGHIAEQKAQLAALSLATRELSALRLRLDPSSSQVAQDFAPAPPSLSPRLQKALERGLDKRRLQSLGLSIEENMALVDEVGLELFAPDFVEALSSLIRPRGETTPEADSS